MTERLSEKNPCNNCNVYNPCTGTCGKWHEWNRNVLQKLAEYETAEDEGRLVILPKCSIGDTVYLPIDFQNKIYTGKIEGFEYSKMRNAWVAKIRTDDEGTCYEAFEDFGKTFFLDIEDAAKALKEMNGKNGEMQ